MKLENQVSNVLLSNRLHELGVHRPSRFYREWTGAAEHEIDEWTDPEGDCCLDNVNCYTVAELGEMLPSGAHSGRADSIASDMPPLYFCRLPEPVEDKWHQEIAQTEANARAAMLIYLIENGLLKP